MLQNEPQTEPSPTPGQIRVTPEELKQAVAAIEGRKQREAQRLAGTIPIEEAVSGLSLDATPEEIWTEVQAQRSAEAARQALSVQTANRQQPFQPQYRPPPVQTTKPQRSGLRRWTRLIPLGALFWVLWGTGILPHIGHTAHHVPPAMTATLAQVPDGQKFYCDSTGLVQISEGKSLPQVHVDAQGSFDNSWTLIKQDGHVYLLAYTLPLDSAQAAKGKPLELFNDDNSGALEGVSTAQTTVRIDGVPLQVSGGDDDYSEITIPNFQPDALTTTHPWR